MDFLQDPTWWTTVSTSVAGACAAVASIVMAVRNARKTAQISKILEDAKERQTYVVCPRCKKKVTLSELQFHLPDGSLDMDLDGQPDDLPR